MYRGQETHPIKVNARYEMNWANSFFKKFRKPHFRQIFGYQRAGNELGTQKCIWVIRVNARYEMNRANSFFKKFQKLIFGQILGHQRDNKANLRDLIAATGLVILLKLDSNRSFSARVTLKFDGWHWKIIGHLFYTTSSFVHHLKSISEFKLELQSGNTQFR